MFRLASDAVSFLVKYEEESFQKDTGFMKQVERVQGLQ